MVTTPSAALEALLNLPPLHIFVEKEARATAYKLRINNPSIGTRRTGSSKAFEDLPNGSIFYARPDGMPLKYDFDKPFSVVVPDRSQWETGQALPSQGLLWFTDGSKTSTGTGAGVYGHRPKAELRFNLGTLATVFQAEVYAIMAAATENLNRRAQNQKIYILSDSRAALGALSSPTIRSRTVQDCLAELQKLGEHNTVVLMWVPGHRNITGNEKADQLAKRASEEQFTGPEPFLHLYTEGLRAILDQWTVTRHTRHWGQIKALRQSKLFLDGPVKKTKSRELISLERTKLRTVVGLFTGHSTLLRHMHKIGVQKDSPTCRRCGEAEETPFHILCECVALARLRLEELGSAFPQPKTYLSLPIKSVLLFVSRTTLLSQE
jgi:ribonuclease HI